MRPYSRDDFYELLHRREALLRGGNIGELALGTQTALLTEDLEHEFLVSSSSSDDGLSDGRHHGAADLGTLAGICHERRMHHDAPTSVQLRAFYETLAAHRIGQAGASMQQLKPKHAPGGGRTRSYLSATWTLGGTAGTSYDSDGGVETPRYSPSATSPSTMAFSQAVRQRQGNSKSGGYTGHSVPGRSPSLDNRPPALGAMHERLALAAAARDVVCSSCMKRVAPMPGGRSASARRPHTSIPATAASKAASIQVLRVHRPGTAATSASWWLPHMPRPHTALTWASTQSGAWLAPAQELEHASDDEDDSYCGIRPGAGYQPRPQSARAQARATRAGRTGGGWRSPPSIAAPPTPDFLRGWLLRRSGLRRGDDVAGFVVDSWDELRSSSMSPHRAMEARHPAPGAAARAGSGSNVMRESLRDGLKEARQYTGPPVPHQAAIEEYLEECRTGARGAWDRQFSGGELVRHSLEASLQRVRMQG